ncbi:MAG TPA: stage III sporulation protein AB [Clostridia bacterium]|nr:stage III sporulation protein AB [Clostridia bacterium]
MIIKLISSIAIIVCCSFLGFHMSYRYTQRINNIRDLRNALSYLETEIVHYSTLLVHAIKNSSISVMGDWKPFFHEIAELLEGRVECSLAEVWQQSLKALEHNPYIDKAEYEIMQRFGLQLGNSDKSSQEKYFQLAQEQLKAEEKSAREARVKYSRMYYNLGIIVGLGIAIILF